MRKLRRILALRYYRIRSKFISQLITSMKTVYESKKTQEDEMYQKYMSHCVVLIQKTWRGFYLRKYLQPRLMRELRAVMVLTAAVKGYKVRKIMFNAREVINIKREMADIGNEMRRTLMLANNQA